MTDDHPLLPQTRLYTVADYDRLPDDGRRFELIDGELIEMHAEGNGQDRLMTVADLDYLPLEGPRYEILGGILFPVPAPDMRHQRVLLALLRSLDQFVAKRELGEVILQPPAVILREHVVTRPDLIFVARGREAIVGSDRIREAPDLVIEIPAVPAIGRALGRKNWYYREGGVREYWTVNLVEEDIAVRSYAEGDGDNVPFLQDGNAESSMLPGLTVNVRQLFNGNRRS